MNTPSASRNVSAYATSFRDVAINDSSPSTRPLRPNAFANFAKANADKSKLGLGGFYPEVATAQIAINNRTSLDEWWQGGTAPMLVVQGLEDKAAVPQNAFNVATKRPKTWLAGIPNCGHNMVFEQPDEIAEHIVAFLKRLGSSGATSASQ